MELDTFVAETLRQIFKGVQTAQQNLDCKGAKINPGRSLNTVQCKQIEFDVAVTVTEGTEKQGKGNVGVALFGIGGQAQFPSTTANSSVSRIKFEVPVIFPTTYE